MSGKDKVIMIGSLPPPFHGSNVYFKDLLNSDIRNEFEIAHLDISDHRSIENLSRLDFTNVRLALSGIFRLAALCRRFSPDLVYVPVASNLLPFLRDGLFILVSSFFSRAAIVIHLHGGLFFRREFYNRASLPVKFFIRKCLSKVGTAIVYTDAMRANFEGLAGNTVSLLNGMSLPGSGCRERSVSGRGHVFGFMGHLIKSKGLLTFLKSAVKLSNRFPGSRFLIAGGWSNDKVELKKAADRIIYENGLSECVTFLGTLNDAERQKFFQEIDLLIFPTAYPYEGCPLVIIEALANGVPVVSSKGIGAIPMMITDGYNGYLADPFSEDDIGNRAEAILSDIGIRSAMRRNARESFEKNFTMEINSRRVADIFRSSLGR